MKKTCEQCNLHCRKINLVKGEFLCGRCKRSNIFIIGDYTQRISLEDALEKKRKVIPTYRIINGERILNGGVISVPICLAGKKVKLSLVEEDE